MITGINHLTLSVRDLAATLAFYVDLLGCRLLARWPSGAYLLAGDVWLAVVVDDAARSAPLPEYSHVAFSVSQASLDGLKATLSPEDPRVWQENWTEGDSVYLLDPSGHKIELHSSTLSDRLAYGRTAPWEGLELFEDGSHLERQDAPGRDGAVR